MPNILIIKIVEDNLMTYYKVNQDYSNLAAFVAALVEEKYPGQVADLYALCDSDVLKTAVDIPKTWAVGPVGGSDFRVMLKSAVTTETIIPPNGMTVGDLLDTDPVVCYV